MSPSNRDNEFFEFSLRPITIPLSGAAARLSLYYQNTHRIPKYVMEIAISSTKGDHVNLRKLIKLMWPH